MLTRIHIQNVAIASEAEVELSAGMSVLTGETGAGKSILIDALNLALGDRADVGVVRHGCDKAIIDVSFGVERDGAAARWLAAHGLAAGDECHVRRVIASGGRSKAFINNGPATLATLRELGEMLVEIHGQHEHQGLTRAGRQRHMLDASGDYAELVAAVRESAEQLRATRTRLEALAGQAKENLAQVELLRYQIDEMRGLDLDGMDIAAVSREHERLAHAEDLREVARQAAQQLARAEDMSVRQLIARLISALQPWREHSAELAALLETLTEMDAMADDAARQMEKMADALNVDPQRARQLDELIAELHGLARKHDVPMRELPECYRQKTRRLAQLERADTDVSELRARQQQLRARYVALSAELHAKRRQAAQVLSRRVTENMQSLGMKGGAFSVEVEAEEDAEAVSAHGRDRVRFMVSANPGQPLLPLSKVASGGELSRISLAVTVICAAANAAPTMIFDEVDSGIGGGVAEVVGRQLRALAAARQVLCVTHLPQVAAQGRHHFRVVKTSTESYTQSRVLALDADGRVQELARMLGGVEVTEASLARARELLGADEAARQAS